MVTPVEILRNRWTRHIGPVVFIVASILSVALFAQYYPVFNRGALSTLAYRLTIASFWALPGGTTYALALLAICGYLSPTVEALERSYRIVARSHAVFLLLQFYIIQFFIPENIFLNRYLLQGTVLAFVIILIARLIVPATRIVIARAALTPGQLRLLLRPSLFPLFLTIYAILWHYTLLFFFNVPIGGIKGDFGYLILTYLAITIVFSGTMHGFSFIPDSHSVIRKLVYAFCFFMFFMSGIIRIVDWGCFYYSGFHIDENVWLHAFYSEGTAFFKTQLAYTIFTLLGISISLYTLFLWGASQFFRRLKRTFPDTSQLTHILWTALYLNTVLPITVIFVIAAVFYFPEPLISRRDPIPYTSIPERLVIKSFLDYFVGDSRERNEQLELTPEFAQKLKQMGISTGQLSLKYPLMKPSIYLNRAAALKRSTPSVPPNTNIIIVLEESLSQFFTKDAAHGVKGLTPQFHDFSQHALTFDNLFNAAFPTIMGQIATLGSFIHIQKDVDMERDDWMQNPIRGQFLFITDILKRKGYQTIHLQGTNAEFAGTETVFRRQGYTDFLSLSDEHLRSYVKQTTQWGLRDRDLFRFSVDYLEKRTDPAPFFMTISTIDLHEPFNCSNDLPSAQGKPMLSCVHSADVGFGVLWSWFKTSRYKDNTVLLLIADHAIPPTATYARIRGESPAPYRVSRFDYITASLYLPKHPELAGQVNTTVSSNLDITPTLLDLMNIDVPNPFLGLSIFRERPDYPLPLGHDPLSDRLSPTDRARLSTLGWTDADQIRYLDMLRILGKRNLVVPFAY